MTTFADFGIQKVRKDKDGNISELLVHRRESNNNLTQLGWYTKPGVIKSIEDGYSYMTVTITTFNWSKGADIHVVNTTSGKYLRTDNNNIASDNLGNLLEG